MGILEGKVSVITGATSGIGARAAEVFAAEGARVVIGGRRKEPGEALARSIGPAAVFHHADVCAEEDVAALVDRAVDTFGGLDVLVNNAGSPSHLTGVMDIDASMFQATLSVHASGTLLGMKHAARVMHGAGGGSIVNMCSVAGHVAGYAGLDYSVAKAAVCHLTRCAAVELGEYGIRVNSVSPGFVLTGVFGGTPEAGRPVASGTRAGGTGAGSAGSADHAGAGGTGAGCPDARIGDLRHYMTDMSREQQPLPGIGSTDDAVAAMVFLASDAAHMITGQDLAVDGGVLAGRPTSVLLAERAHIAGILAEHGPAGG